MLRTMRVIARSLVISRIPQDRRGGRSPVARSSPSALLCPAAYDCAVLLRLVLLVAILVPSVAHAADDRFGVAFVSPPGKVADAKRLDQAAQLGAGWDRQPLYWNEVQPTPNGPFDFSKFDATVAADVSRGIKVQGILLGSPDWAKTGASVDMAAWSRFVAAAVRHYKGRIGRWEMWNEPDLLDGDGKGRYWPWGVV